MRFLPIFVDTQSQKIVVIGGGPAAQAKLRTLLKTDARITVVNPEATSEIRKWADEGLLKLSLREYQVSDFNQARLIYAATEHSELNANIAAEAKKRGILVNAADQKADCSFYSPAIVDRDPIVIAIGSEGTSPGLSRAIKADIEQKLPKTLGVLAAKIAELRRYVAEKLPNIADRQRLWANVFGGKNLSAKMDISPEDLKKTVERALDGELSREKAGKVSLVGAGPGSLDLLTLGAQRRLHRADVIVYDRLVSQEVLDMGRREAKYIYVGKAPGAHTTRQEEINRIIVQEALNGHFVVRLKGGDPLVFGRADEEIEALRNAGVDFEIVPGITSAAAAAASIGASLTSRGHNKSVALLTGHDSKGFAEQDWVSLAQPHSRAAIYMGLGASRFIQGRLLLHGAARDYPVTIVENASRDNEVIVYSTLGNLVQDIDINGITGPSILLLGYSSLEQYAEAGQPLRAMK